jgi:UDP-4-amino-4,6-dideoxy-N-acetyl-beta-L-altrosamine N-acetyltransferase
MDSTIILTEAGDRIGLGHLTRCLALQNTAIKLGIEVRLVVNFVGDLPGSFKGLFECGNWHSELDSILDADYKLCIVDSYLASRAEYENISNRCGFLAVIDDFQRLDYPAECIINPSLYGHKLHYPKSIPLISGSNSILLRKEFRSNFSNSNINKIAKNLLITLGGTDPYGYVPLMIEKFRNDFNLQILCGSDVYQEELRAKIKENYRITLYGLCTASKVKTIMESVDIAISAGGQTLHELSVLGVPTVPVCIGDDQKLNLDEYVNLNVFNSYGSYDKPNLMGEIIRSVYRFSDIETRNLYRAKVKKIISLDGPTRVLERLVELRDSKIKNLNIFSLFTYDVKSFNSLSLNEIKNVLIWRNHPQVRKNMKNTNMISLEDHLLFIEGLIVDKSNWYWTVNNSNEGIGVIYLNDINYIKGEAYLGVYVNFQCEMNGKGKLLMTMLVYIGFALLGLKCIKLEVRKENLTAVELYHQTGFIITERIGGLIKMKISKNEFIRK